MDRLRFNLFEKTSLTREFSKINIELWLTLGVVAIVFLGLLESSIPPDLLFVGAAVFFAATGIITPEEAFNGFSNSGMLTIAFLFVIVAGLRETGVLDHFGQHVLGNVRTVHGVIARLAVLVVPLSAVMNNTPVVAMFVPVVVDWCRQHAQRISFKPTTDWSLPE